MAAERLKADKDFSKEVDALLPVSEKLSHTNLTAAIEKLSLVEKQARQASDLPSTSRILIQIVTLCKDREDWGLLNEQVLLLSKKHGQLKQAITKMVQVVMGFLGDAPSMEKKMQTIETLRTVTEGKIFVEVERARVTRILSNIKKEQGDINAATDILCELQVETFGSMSRREKTDFILEQVGMCIEKGDWTQAGILSRKISTRYFARRPKKTPEQLEIAKKEREELEKNRNPDDPPLEKLEDDVTDLKLRFYEQQILLAKHDNKYLDACKYYRHVLDTASVEENPDQLKAVLKRVVYFVILAPHDNEQSDLLQRIKSDTRYATLKLKEETELLRRFTLHELMPWPTIRQQFSPYLCATDVFAESEEAAKVKGDVKSLERWQDLRKRVIEHNVRVVAKYYTRIYTSRLTELLDLNPDETENYISELVTAKTIYARIDRPAGIVSFAKPRDADDVLNEWSWDMKTLLGLLERIDHLITKEEMMARIKPGKGKGRTKGKGKGRTALNY